MRTIRILFPYWMAKGNYSLNKSDLEIKSQKKSLKENLAKRLKHSEDIRILRTSTIDPSSENSGMEELEETIRNMFFEGKLSITMSWL